jgi:hypothetical protein
VERAMLVDELRTIFASRKPQDLLASRIVFKESFDPIADPQDDYRVIYEAAFEPADLDKARIEFWLTDTGHTAVGVETYARITQRLQLRAIRHGFAAGHEPRTATVDSLRTLFDILTLGKFFIVVRSLLRVVSSVQLYMTESDRDTISRLGYPSNWISSIPSNDPGRLAPWRGEVLTYRPW